MSADRHLPAGPTLQIQHRTYWYVSKVVKGEFINNKLPLPVIPPVVVQQMRSSTPQVVQPDHAEVTTPTEIESDDDAAVNPAVLTPTGIELSGCSASPSTQADRSTALGFARPIDIMDVSLRCVAERALRKNKQADRSTASGFARPIDIMDAPLLW